jgi:hypothetical protein
MKPLCSVLIMFFLSSCVLTSSLLVNLPESHLLTELDASHVYSVSADGDLLAYVDNGLHLLRLSDQYRQQLTFDSPVTVLWNPDGTKLIAVFREIEKTRLVSLSASADDRPQIFIDEIVTDLAWLADGRLLAVAHTEARENDLLNLEVSLLIWDGQWDVERIPLYQKRFNYRPAEFDPAIAHKFDLSPLKDELVYNRYLSPPTNGGRVELVLYNLQTRRELVLAEVENTLKEGLCAADGEAFLLPDGRGQVVLKNPWLNSVSQKWDVPGRHLATAAGRKLFYVDGTLFDERRALLELPVTAEAQFSSDSKRLFVASRGKLYLYSGYAVPEAEVFSGVEKVRLQRIRQQRSLGEISIREYYQLKNNILNP